MEELLKKYLLIVILLCIGSFVSTAYSSTYIFEGHIHDIFTQEPINDFPVNINIGDLIIETVTTDSSGFYTYTHNSDINPQFVIVVVNDCFGDILYEYFEPPTDTNVANFESCLMADICDAVFYYEFNFENSFQVNFFDQSFGDDINKWTWDFGDYNVSNEINPTHEYTEPGVYQVVLVVEDTNGVCWSAYDEFVDVDQGFNCKAYFEYSVSPSEMFTVMFTDASDGNINNWMWDFGDFTFSEEINPSHIYSEVGLYNVCLTISDSSYNCMDTYCMTIFVGDTISCNADFEANLDTLNNIPHTFIFSDNSTGNISSWFWDFGDGNFSMEQNPVHVYDDEGDYFVCLTVSNDGGGNMQCFDEKCIEVSTLNYYTFGGHAFIDGFTINVEENDSSNIATAFLYRRFSNQWKYMDEREFWKFGYYWFVDKPEGEYLLRVNLKEESEDFGNYAPSYFGGATNWVYAQTFELKNNDQLAVNINLHGLESTAAGVGVISGFLQQGESCTDEIALGGQIIKLFNNESKFIAYTYSNQAGEFEFSSLSNGSYKLQAELTGNLSSLEYVEISSSNPFSDGHVLEINCDAFVGINESEFISYNFKVKEVFPMPATNIVNLRVQSVNNCNIAVEIIDQMGRVFKQYPINISSGESLISLDVRSIKSGLYIYRVTAAQGNVFSAGKILISK